MKYEDVLAWWKNYLALSVYDKTGEISGFKEFLKEQMVKTWEKKKKVPVNLNMFL